MENKLPYIHKVFKDLST